MKYFSIVVEVHTVLTIQAADLESAQAEAESKVVDGLLEGTIPGNPEMQESWGDECEPDGDE